jgi:hypothetical protein
MDEKRKDQARRDLIDRVAERAAERGAAIALQKFGDLTPWDMSTKEGRELARETIRHADSLRRGCNAVKAAGSRGVVKSFFWFVMLIVIGGFVWFFNIDPNKVKFLGGP